MKIDRIVIKNFRAFKLLDVKLTEATSCVIGENNTGKSGILHAIRLCIDANLSSAYRTLISSDIHTGASITRPCQVLIGLEISGFSGNTNEEALVGAWQHEPGRARLFYRFRPKLRIRESIEAEEIDAEALKLSDYQWEIVGGGDPSIDLSDIEWDDTVGAPIRFGDLQAFQVVYLPALRDVENDLRNFRNSPLAKLIGVTDIDDSEKETLVAILKDANAKIADSPSISEVAEAIDTSFKEVAGPVFGMDVALGLAEPSFQAIVRALRILLSNHAMNSFEPSCNGLGLNNILYVSIWIEYFKRRLAQDNSAGQLILCEEPEAHLHPQLQLSLFKSLKALPFQSILTTHSTHITANAGLASYIVLTQTEDAATTSCAPALSADLTSGEMHDLERYLDATKSVLLFARKVMLVEGPAELFLIPPLVKRVMGVDLEREGISVVPIYGIHFDAYTKLFGTSVLPKRCAIVTDGDLKPSDADTSIELEDDLPPPPKLESLESKYVKVFACKTTFERAVTLTGNLEMFAKTAAHFGANRVAEKLENIRDEQDDDFLGDAEKAASLRSGRTLVLNTAKRVGKARFSQIAASNIRSASELPKYIRDAVTWLKNDEID